MAATDTTSGIPGPHFGDFCLRLVGQANRLHQRRNSASLSTCHLTGLAMKGAFHVLSASRSSFVLQRQCVSPAGFRHELLKLAAILDGFFQILSQLIRNVNRKTLGFRCARTMHSWNAPAPDSQSRQCFRIHGLFRKEIDPIAMGQRSLTAV